MSWFSRKKEVRSEELISISDPRLAILLGYSGGALPLVSEQTAMTLSAVWRAVWIVSGSVAMLPLRTYLEDEDEQKARQKSFLDYPAGKNGKETKMTPFEWKQLVLVHLLLRGNAYLQHLYNGAGSIAGLWPVFPGCVHTEADDDVPGGKRFDVTDAKGQKRSFDASNMTHLHGVSIDGLTGLSPVGVARQSLGTALSGDKAAHRMFTNGAMVSGLVTPDDGEDITPAEAQVVKDHINQKVLGTDNAGDIPVMNKRLKFQQWSLSAEDAQFLQSRTFQIDEIGRWFGVPPHLLGLTEKSTSWGQGIAEQNRGLARYNLMTWTTPIEERLSLLLSENKFAEFDYSMFMRPSPEDEIELLIKQVDAGLLTLNEARKIRNLPPIKDPMADIPRAGFAQQAPAAPGVDSSEGGNGDDTTVQR